VKAGMRRFVGFAVALATLVAMGFGGLWVYRTVMPPGESFGSVPEGVLSDLVWHGEHLYFLHGSRYGSGESRELWRMRPGEKAVRVPVGDDCPIGEFTAVAPGGDGLILAITCEVSFDRVVTVDVDGSRSRLVAGMRGREGYPAPIDQILWMEGDVYASWDGSVCSGIGRVTDRGVVPVPPVTVDGVALDVGRSPERARMNCRDLPLGGFLTDTGDALAVLASPSSIGREDIDWSVYRTTRDWGSTTRLAGGFREPVRMHAYGERGLLVAATRSDPGIWLVPDSGRAVEQVLEGRFADFAVDPSGEFLAVLGQSGHSGSLRLVRF
jgi:hypothetical protein